MIEEGSGKKYKHTMTSLLAEWTNREGGYLHQKFSILLHRPFDDPTDADALCAALNHPRADELDGDPNAFWLTSDPAWFTIAWKMYRASNSVKPVIGSKGLPQIRRRLDLALSETAIWRQQDRGTEVDCRLLNGQAHHFIFLLSLLILYRDSDAIRLTNLAARHPRFENGGNDLRTLANWLGVFSCLPSDSTESQEIFRLLRYPLPRGQAALGFLAFSNRMLQEMRGEICHPFDCPEGLVLLQRLAVVDDDEGVEMVEDPDAIFVVEALPFIKAHGKDLIVAKLAKHHNKFVRSALRRTI
jgi:hypothetical protein